MIQVFLVFVFYSIVTSLSTNPQPYYENGKLNSPLMVSFVPADIGFYNNHTKNILDGLTPQQYTQYQQNQYNAGNNENYPFGKYSSSIHKIQLVPIAETSNSQQQVYHSNNKIFKNKPYNSKYPFTPPVIKYRIGVVSDLDENSIEKIIKSGEGEVSKNWDSFIKEGSLSIQYNEKNPELSNISIEWNKEQVYKIRTGFNYAGRGMELSTLNVFNGKIYSCDDKTGIIYELPLTSNLLKLEPVPWAILADGNFTGPEGFKCEWGTIKNEHLWIGGHGISVINNENNTTLKNQQKFVKKISPLGEVIHLDWRNNFDKMTQALNIKFPGYVTHESAGWSNNLQKWVFMPRRISKLKFSSSEDKKSGSNVVIIADENFDNIKVTRIGSLVPTHGFTSFKWIPGTDDQIVVALKTVENGGAGESYIMAFNMDGTILFKETKFADQKFEGFEFI